MNTLQKISDKKMEDLATGKAKSIPDVMIAAEKAASGTPFERPAPFYVRAADALASSDAPPVILPS